MEKLPRIRRRISTLREFHEIVRALEAMAASQSRAAVAALEPARAHLALVQATLAALGSATEREAPPPPAALIVLGSEHGFVGALNERLVERATPPLRAGPSLHLVGRRAQQVFLEAGLSARHRHAMASHVEVVPDLAGRLAAEVDWAPSLTIIHPRHIHGGRVEVIERQLFRPLPADKDDARPLPLSIASPLDRPLTQLPAPDLLAGLARELVFSTLAEALVETLVSENAARLAAMQAADRNIRDRLAALGRAARTLRQEEITAELIDIVTGAEAVRSEASGTEAEWDAAGQIPPGLAVSE